MLLIFTITSIVITLIDFLLMRYEYIFETKVNKEPNFEDFLLCSIVSIIPIVNVVAIFLFFIDIYEYKNWNFQILARRILFIKDSDLEKEN